MKPPMHKRDVVRFPPEFVLPKRLPDGCAVDTGDRFEVAYREAFPDAAKRIEDNPHVTAHSPNASG